MVKEQKNKIHLPSIDDLFSTEEQRQDEKLEKVIDIKLDEIDPFKNHPFKVIDNDELQQMKESIIEKGVISPVLLRKKDNGRYEMISGHRRKKASELAGIQTIPAIVRDLTDDEAIVAMVDSNMQRERLLPSEKAFAYKMKLEAIKHQGIDASLSPLGTRHNSGKSLEEKVDDSRTQIYRYIRLTHLIPELLQFADNEVLGLKPKMGLRPSVEISYLSQDEQRCLLDCIECYAATPSLAQAIQLKELSQTKKLTQDIMYDIMSSEKPNQIFTIKFNEERLRNVLPKNIKNENIEDYVVKSIEYYSRYLKNRELSSKKDSR